MDLNDPIRRDILLNRDLNIVWEYDAYRADGSCEGMSSPINQTVCLCERACDSASDGGNWKCDRDGCVKRCLQIYGLAGLSGVSNPMTCGSRRLASRGGSRSQ